MRGLRLAMAVVAVACTSLPGAVAAAATLTVNTTRDELVRHDGKCSLREAINAVNAPTTRTDCGRAGRASNSIVLRPGRYVLSIPAAGADDNASGDLNVNGGARVTVSGPEAGARAGAVVIDGRGAHDRVLSVGPGASLTLVDLTVTGGRARDGVNGSGGGVGCAAPNGLDAGTTGSGGGIFNSGRLVLETVAVTGNRAGAGGGGASAVGPGCPGGTGGTGGSGGGIYNHGSLVLTASGIYGNRAGAGGPGGSGAAGSGGPGGADGSGGPGGEGGGIFSTGGNLTLLNSTLSGDAAGAGGAGGGPAGSGGAGGSGGGIAVSAGRSVVRNATVADNSVGAGGGHGTTGGTAGAGGAGGGLFVQASATSDDMSIQNTIVASNVGSGCAGSTGSAIVNAGHDLTFPDNTCPGRRADPKLRPLKDYGGATETMALGPGGAAIDRIPSRRAGCPATDQRGVSRPQGRSCDIGADEFAIPQITMIVPSVSGSYERNSRLRARFVCDEGGVASTIAVCKGSIAPGHAIGTGRLGTTRFVVSARDKSGVRARKTIRYYVWEYVNPLRAASGLVPRRIDLGVDYHGAGPLLAIGRAVITTASNSDDGPPSCWAVSCWPGGGIVVYRLLDGPFAGKYVYGAENITVTVRPGQIVAAGQQIAILHYAYPWLEIGWAAGRGPEALGIADGHHCACSDPGGWSAIEGRDMNHLLVQLGAPSGYLQATPNESMPPGWPTWSR